MKPTEAQITIDMCQHYATTGWSGYPPFMPRCSEGRRASLRCHSKREDCPDYIPSLAMEAKDV